MTQFHLKRGGLSLTLTDQGKTYNPKYNPKQLPMKLWGLVGIIAPTVHTTQQTILIGSLAKSGTFQCLMKLWGLVGMVTPTLHTTQQTILIDSLAKSGTFHWLRHFCQYLNQHLPSPNAILTTDIS